MGTGLLVSLNYTLVAHNIPLARILFYNVEFKLCQTLDWFFGHNERFSENARAFPDHQLKCMTNNQVKHDNCSTVYHSYYNVVVFSYKKPFKLNTFFRL